MCGKKEAYEFRTPDEKENEGESIKIRTRYYKCRACNFIDVEVREE